MPDLIQIKKTFLFNRDELFNSFNEQTDALDFSKRFSFLIENTIRDVCSEWKLDFVIASSGSFARREISPYSDIDIMLITESSHDIKDQINSLITSLFDSGIEVSHTVREFSDINLFLEKDFQAFTQFFETKFIYGNKKLYDSFIEKINSLISTTQPEKILQNFLADQEARYRKYGNSPKFLEPNVKMSAGGLRDLQFTEWMYLLLEKGISTTQTEISQTETLIREFIENDFCTSNEGLNILNSYKFLLKIRHLLHLETKSKTDRFEFDHQIKISQKLHQYDNHISLMKDYFNATNTIYRFTKSIIKKFTHRRLNSLPDLLSYNLDEDFFIKGNVIYSNNLEKLQFADILRAFYYRGKYNAMFDIKLRATIIEKVANQSNLDLIETGSSVFFREILKLPKNVGETLSAMNELGVLGAFIPEFKDLNGFMQVGVYHCYTADEHTLCAIKNLEKLYNDNSFLGTLFKRIKNKEILYLAMLFHDIAKPISISGHELLGAEIAASLMERLGYNDQETDLVCFLVRNHLHMEQVAFRRNLNDPQTLDNFAKVVDSYDKIDMLYLVTYADLSAVNPAVWTTWKAELLGELYRKIRKMFEDNLTGEQLLRSTILVSTDNISQHSDSITDLDVKEHINSLNDDVSYIHHFSEEEIAKHIEEIESGKDISIMFDEKGEFTHITVITSDHPALLSKLCGVFAINDVNIHDARIFTRKDGIVIDSFNVLDFKTHSKVSKEKYQKLEDDFHKVLSGFLQLNKEVSKLKSRWKRLEKKLFSRESEIKVSFDQHDKYTIIDVSSPDRLGFLYHLTTEMSQLGLIIYFAKISTKGDDIVDSFYVLNQFGKKISPVDYDLIRTKLIEAINQIL
ncbi:MAG: HD domain-containing protein [Ignavibacterium sp.]|nr:HD domain-containing protein [Ignavibacterium sp.]MCX7610779.1 HD domain-containing protein [Ignavibacterium sp.]MDW8375618.1 HD domain-containing protein [Ignavibacteriales bacterium]